MNDLLCLVVDFVNMIKFKLILVGLNFYLVSVDWVGKIGIINDYKDLWLIVFILIVILSFWLGYDLLVLMMMISGDNNGNYMVNLVNVLYYVNLELFGIG